jgi:hypothetical protein
MLRESYSRIPEIKQEVLERTKLPTFFTLVYNTVLELHILVSIVTSPTIVAVVTLGATMGPIVAQVYIELSYENGMVAMVTDMVPR